MKSHKWKLAGVLVLLAWFGMGMSLARAQGIPPVDASGTPIPGSPVTVSIFDLSGADITDTWLPVPGEPIIVHVNGENVINFVLVDAPGTALTTSRYPGETGNFGDPADTSLDFTEPVTTTDLNSYELIPTDSGARAVILVNGAYTFVIPRDDDGDWIPTIWEILNCPSGNCEKNADIDIGPDASSPPCDGWANIDEYRGWRVNGVNVRGDPQVKDIFLHLEGTPQCIATAGTFTGDGGSPVDLSFFFTDADLATLFANLNTLGINVHRIRDDEWVDNFDHYDAELGTFLTGISPENGITDRRVNINAIVPLGNEDGLGRRFVKGVRVVECLDLVDLSPLGLADKKPPDLFHPGNGTALLFTHRILRSFLSKIEAGGERFIQYFTFQSGSWQEQYTIPASGTITWDPTDPPVDNLEIKAFFRDIVFPYFLAHEAGEHSYDVTSTSQGTNKVSYGYHHAEGTGTNVDVKVTHKVDKKTSGFNKFYIPSRHGTSDEREMRILTSQLAPY